VPRASQHPVEALCEPGSGVPDQMKESWIRRDLFEIYQGAYVGGKDSEWLRLGALGKVDNIAKLASKYPHDSVLEIGAGNGEILQRLAEVGFGQKIYAAEISKSGIAAIGEKRIRNLEQAALFDGHKLPFEDQEFDLAIMSHVVEHLEHPRELLYEACRVARYVFVEVPLEIHLRTPRNFVLDTTTGHINFYTAKSIRWLLQSCNMSILDEMITCPSMAVHRFSRGAYGMLMYWIKAPALRLLPWVAVSLFSYHCSLMARSPHSGPRGNAR
jgi:ubiquinone/menaquinone biosynthesis C-methylase UbiE